MIYLKMASMHAQLRCTEYCLSSIQLLTFYRACTSTVVQRPDANYFGDLAGIHLFRKRTIIPRGERIYSTCWLLVPEVYIYFSFSVVTHSIIEMQLNRRTTMDSDLISPGTVRSRPGHWLPAPWPACQLVKF